MHRPDAAPVHAAAHAPVRQRKRKGGMAIDQFAVDPEMIPDGMSYEWKRVTTYGAREPAYEVLMAEQGWEPVPVSRHPQFMPEGYKGPIERGGLVLMERPIELTMEARAEAERDAREVVRVKEEQLGMTPTGTLTREHPSARANTYVNRGYEPPMAIPE
jgi:hypothetical protein